MNDYVTRPEWTGVIDAIDKRFDRLEETVRHQGVLHERLESKVDAVIEALETKASKTELRDEIAKVEVRIDRVEWKVDALTSRVETVEAKVDAVDAKVDAVDAKVDAVDAKVDAVDAKVDEVRAKVDTIIQILRSK